MPLKIQNSKFRHVYGQATRKDGCFENIRITKNAHDSMFCAVNPKFMAVVLESIGGGSFLVLPVNQVGRVDINAPKISGHSGPVNDIKWNPFDDHVIASASDDLTIKIWEIPEHGLSSSMPRMLTELHGHGRRVTYIEWHPTAENVLLSAAFDYRCIVWNVGSGSAMNVISCHTNTIYSISWSPDGALFATSCKDKKIRIIDPRTGCVLQEGKSHAGLKTCKLVFLKDHKLFTTGFSRLGDRELALWDGDNLAEPIYKDSIDYSSGVLLPYYDSDLGVIYLAGKGDGNIRYYEIVDRNVVYLNQYPSSDPQRSLGMMPKRALDCTKCEIARFYKLHTNKALIEPLPMIVPRRSDEFQEDIYPPSSAGVPACTAEEWASGVDRKPVTLSMMELAERSKGQTRVGSLRTQKAQLLRTQVVAPVKVEKPPPTTAPASLQNIYKLSSNSSLNLSATSRPTARMHQPAKAAAPQHMNSSGNSSSDASPAQVSSFTSFSFNQSANENQRPKQTSPQRQPITARPASPTKVATPPSNSQPIKQAHIRPSIVQPVAHRSSPESSPEPPRILPSQIASQQNGSNQPSRWRNNSAWQKPAAPIAQPSERPISFNKSGRNNRPRQISAPVAPHMIREQDNVQKVKPSDPSQSLPNNELHKAYFKQCEEIKLLRVQNSEKDKKIDALERELVQLKKMIITL